MALFLYPNQGSLFLAKLIDDYLQTGNTTVKLFKNNIIPSSSTVLGDLEEADFTDYVAFDVDSLPPPYLDPVLGGASFQITTQWTVGTATIANTIYGFYIVDTTGPSIILAIGTFDAPIPMAAPGDAIPLTIKLNYGS